MHIPLVSGDNWASVVTSWAKGCSLMGSAQSLDLSLLANAKVSTSDPPQTLASSESGCYTLTPCLDPFLIVIIESCRACAASVPRLQPYHVA